MLGEVKPLKSRSSATLQLGALRQLPLREASLQENLI